MWEFISSSFDDPYFTYAYIVEISKPSKKSKDSASDTIILPKVSVFKKSLFKQSLLNIRASNLEFQVSRVESLHIAQNTGTAAKPHKPPNVNILKFVSVPHLLLV